MTTTTTMVDLEKMRPLVSSAALDQKNQANGLVSLRSGRPSRIEPAARRSARPSLRVLDCRPRFGSSPFMGSLRSPSTEPTGRLECIEDENLWEIDQIKLA
jgi:hypothetical protein